MTTLLVQASARDGLSVSRRLSAQLAERIGAEIVLRDLAAGVPHVDQHWASGAYKPPADRTTEEVEALRVSDALVAEVMDADTLVIGTPVYNFGVPSALKAWMDQVARAGVTFQFTEKGPVGLLENKRAFIVATSGGVEIGSEVDHMSRHLTMFLNFIGITDVQIITADRLLFDEGAEARAAQEIDALPRATAA